MKGNIPQISEMFCEDITIVHSRLRQMFRGRICDKAQVAHWMLNVGMIDEVKDILEDKEKRKEVGIVSMA